MFIQGQIYRRSHLHDQYGGQRQGGISTPADQPFIFLFTSDAGEQFGYSDGWDEDGVFVYTGEGQRGDMEFVRGNLAIRQHIDNGKDLFIFSQAHRAHVRFVSQMVCVGHHTQIGADMDGDSRQVIVFELVPLEELAVPAQPELFSDTLDPMSLEELRRRALATATEGNDPVERRNLVHFRSRAIKRYVETRANGQCEGCGASAPFNTKAGRPYIETHHIWRLSDGGPDHPLWVAGVCPNCHRRAHYSSDGTEYNQHLAEIVRNLEN